MAATVTYALVVGLVYINSHQLHGAFAGIRRLTGLVEAEFADRVAAHRSRMNYLMLVSTGPVLGGGRIEAEAAQLKAAEFAARVAESEPTLPAAVVDAGEM